MIAEASLSDCFFWQNSQIPVIDGECFQVLLCVQFQKPASCLKINSYDIAVT